MDAQSYESWYETPRGRWIGERETALILEGLQPSSGESLLDVGCGTGFFTRNLSASMDGEVVGVDINQEWLEYARLHSDGRATFDIADARSLPYATASFDLVISITALCFIEEQLAAVREILRVARRRFAIGLLNRHSILWLRKGCGGGTGGYQGAHWNTVNEVRRLFRDLPVERLRFRTAIQIPTGGPIARFIERISPSTLTTGAFLLVIGEVTGGAHGQP
ncbi:class I SAM-dependent methyltransferase [Microbulbifer rhizosphaerae]|uniref:SAM-dependent methyltransferase n=1 Tax=Microbulbifer rhizosphaerae TaxID=1562603 RepID=A0A7W4WDV7_9GAMM|nr:class I SAM-dependent methyltransferase [Microbulbifer rhizosphaerae]MBB3061746.1 SAM-dependent methyltransferase [Microbulbifer rhizosphaerae]